MPLLKMDTGRWHRKKCNYRNQNGYVMEKADRLPVDVDPATLCRHCLKGEYLDRTDR